MCTLSFIPSDVGYVVAMNRDERFVRPHGLPPKKHKHAIYPTEPSGGAWLAVNSNGLTLAIMNRNASGPVPARLRSRGELIPQLISAQSLAEVHRGIVEIELKNTLPFRLVAFSQRDQEICEWRWGTRVARLHYEWQHHHWYSSGISDVEAEHVRSDVTAHAWALPDAGKIEWLRQLHRSHEPEGGAFSICVHRRDAATVSYNEVVVDNQHATFRYFAGSPCEPGEPIAVTLALRKAAAAANSSLLQ